MENWTILRRTVRSLIALGLALLMAAALIPETVYGSGKGEKIAVDEDALTAVLRSVEQYGIRRDGAALPARRTAGEQVTVSRGDQIYYPASLGGGWSTFYYYLNGHTAYCLEPPKGSPPSGTELTANPLEGNEELLKVLYYGFGGPGDCTDDVLGWGDAGLRYLFTHIAASFAYCGWDAFKGCTQEQLEECGVWYFINYIRDLPKVPDARLEFSGKSFCSFPEGEIQKTENITLLGDSRNFVKIPLPDQVTLQNITKEREDTGGEGLVWGGDTFCFKAPLSMTGTLTTGELFGNMNDDWKAVITSSPGQMQTLGGIVVHTSTSSPVSLEVRWLQLSWIELEKTDGESGFPLAGAVYGIFLEPGCENLVGEIGPTAEDGKAVSEKFPPSQEIYYVREIQAPVGYLPDPQVYEVEVKPGQKTVLHPEDVVGKGSVVVSKVDSESGKYEPQGDASLIGAIYGLYAREDIVHPDGRTGILYAAGSVIGQGSFGESGSLKFEDLFPGKYYLKEIQAPEGYLLDEKEYELDLAWEPGQETGRQIAVTVREQVMRQAFRILKVSGNGESAEMDKLKGAEFTVKLKSQVEKTGWDKAEVKDLLVTDAQGAACSKELPYGVYLVRETKVPEGTSMTKDFVVTVDGDSREPQFWRVLNDGPFESYIRMRKLDAVTGKEILLAGTVFQIRNRDTNEIVSQKVGDKKVDKFITDDTGTVTTPLKLPRGNYELIELQAPEGYVLTQERIPFQVGQEGAVQVPSDEDQDYILDVRMENQRQTGNLRILKYGEVLTGYDEDFLYGKSMLSGVRFAIIADEDIYTPDHRTDEGGKRKLAVYGGKELAKDTVVAETATDEKGTVSLKQLPLGRYRVEELGTAEGYVLDMEPRIVELCAPGQTETVGVTECEWQNERQKGRLYLHKKDGDSGEQVSGAVYGIYCGENIVDADGNVLAEKDTLLERQRTGEDGNLTFEMHFPLGKYYVCELESPQGYQKDEMVYPVEFSCGDEREKTIDVHLTVKDYRTPGQKVIRGESVRTGQKGFGITEFLTVLVSTGICVIFLWGKRKKRKNDLHHD